MRLAYLVINSLLWFNNRAINLGKQLSWLALVVMVLVILLQVVMRYVFNNALAWPDEAARFCMLWLTGLMAPAAYRIGGFVGINALYEFLPVKLAQLLSLVLLLIAGLVLGYAISFGWDHTFGFAGRFNSSSLKLPLDWFGGEIVRVQLRYMYASLFVGVILLFTINIELMIRNLFTLVGAGNRLPAIPEAAELSSIQGAD